MSRRERPKRKRQLKRGLGSSEATERPLLYSDQEEDARADVIRRLELLDTEPEERFDRICRMAGDVMNAPATYIALLDRHRQWFKSTEGMGEMKETPREGTFCDYAIRRSRPTVVLNADEDPLFKKSPYVTDGPQVKFYAGFPLSVDGQRVGTLCALDFEPRGEVTDEQLEKFYDLARLAEQELVQREAEDSGGQADATFVGPATFLKVNLAGIKELISLHGHDLAVSVVNLYFETFIALSKNWNAVVDDLTMDGLHLIFQDETEHSVKALACAVEIQTQAEEIYQILQERELPILGVSIGLHSDKAVVANLGARDLWRPTLLAGDAEAAGKLAQLGLDGSILATEQTALSLAESIPLSGKPSLRVSTESGEYAVYDLTGLIPGQETVQ